MDEITFEKFHLKYKAEKEQILIGLAKMANPISNNGNVNGLLPKAAEIALKMPELWAKGGADKKDALQKVVFPEVIVYDRHKGAFRTMTINPVFEFIQLLSTVSGGIAQGASPLLLGKSTSAEREGFEPPEPVKVQRFSRPPH
jgi:hypothetical protein